MAAVMVPVRVRADLAGGVAQAAPWGIALDGLLASVMWDQVKASGQAWTRARETAVPADLDLPLARCVVDEQQWHWAASCARPVGPVRSEVRSWSGRVDARELEQVAGSLPAVVSGRQGRFRARRMPLLVSVCQAVVWQAVGDPQLIEDLLGQVGSIGKKRAAGEGEVVRWQVQEALDVDVFQAGHLHVDGSWGRPGPMVCRLRAGQVEDGGVGRAGLRPPYMHPGRQQDVVLPALLGS